MASDPKMDFRYTNGEVEIEGYQITPASRWQDQKWPEWLKMQRLPDEMNALFSMSEDPNRLWIKLPNGDVELPELAWVVRYADGHLGYIEALEMEEWTKVVPIPPPVVHPEAGEVPANVLEFARPTLTAEAEGPLREALLRALTFLQSDDAAEAQEVLKDTLGGLVGWCKCSPGKCEELDQLSCRQHSPLIK